MKILRSAARPPELPSPYPLFPLFPKSKRKGLNQKTVNRAGSGGGSTALCPRPAAPGAIRLRPSWAAGCIKCLPSARVWHGKQVRGFG